ncbi:MAG: phosphatase PAP2 family protein, partial [Actinomycetota bacterium]|nr:phosphatase PAP2 family protein [Actinomycetota bacterium]
AIFRAINSLAAKSGVLDFVFRVGADDHIIPALLTIIIICLVLSARNHEEREIPFDCLIFALAAVIISTILMSFLNASFFRPRPFTSLGAETIFYHNTDSSYPSNAATLVFALSFSTIFHKRKLGLAMVFASLYLGFCRVAVGVHYPLDILAGALLALACAFLCRLISPLLEHVSSLLLSAWYRLLLAYKPKENNGSG